MKSNWGTIPVLSCTCPVTTSVPLMYEFPPTPIPPLNTADPAFSLSALLIKVTLSCPFNVVLPLTLSWRVIVTGPSNCDRTNPDVPPSTIILSLTVTSSKATLNFEGSCPVIVGFGIS